MSERSITALGALLALALIVGIFVRPSAKPTMTLPRSIELGVDGYRGLDAWLASEGVPVVSLRDRFDTLSEMTTDGNLLITTLPYQKGLQSREAVELLRWVARGNSLMILAALDDTPSWSLVSDTTSFTDDMESLSGAIFEAASTEDGEPLVLGNAFGESDVTLAVVRAEHPLTEGVVDVTAVTDSTASIWIPSEDSISPGEPFLIETSSGLDAAWVDEHGRGSIITFAASTPFTNRALAETDNRRLLANIVRWHMGSNGSVIFDDYHQGLSELYDPEAFYSDTRVGVTILFVLAFWFFYMIGTQNRMTPVREPVATPQQGDFVAAIGGFFARKVSQADTARLMFDRWFAELEGRGALRGGTSPWDYLAASPLIEADRIEALKATHDGLAGGAKVDLKRLNNDIQSIREALG